VNDNQTYGAQTDPGCKRALNEDTYGALVAERLWFVADGMGGHSGGDVASRIVRDEIIAGVTGGKDLVEAIVEAHLSLQAAAERGEGSRQMGSTVVALRGRDSGYQIAWVGDSRAYLWDGALHQLSRDHSLVQEYLDSRKLDAGSIDLSQWSNAITQCLGPANSGTPRVDEVNGEWHGGEKILLCSDGLHGELGDQEIAALLAESATQDDQSLAERLVQAAREAGGADNVTAVLVSAPANASPGRSAGQAGQPLAAIALGVAAACLVALIIFYFTNW
jgi:protein phosphatase